MASGPPLSLLFLWHQHQPMYKDALADHYELPWVRLHATKDYYDMAAVLDEFPSIKSNFNLVPSLLIQLDDYAQGKAKDKFLKLTAKRPAELSFEEHQFILHNFFMAHWEHMIDPYPRYRQLLDKRGRKFTAESLLRVQKEFKDQDWLDLQIWFNLAWFDPLWREKDPFIRGLFEKGKHFTEDEKHHLMDKQREVCALVAAKHRELQDRGQIEVTTTPFYHPILPLLCDTESARVALPGLAFPERRFAHPEDAREQIKRAIDDYTARFGRAPQGMWPSEGSVSPEAAQLIAEAGIRWIATDEEVLAHSLSKTTFRHDDLYEPYAVRVGERTLNIFFRDHELSDAVGFVYASWEPQAAADHFMRRLHDIRNRLVQRDGGEPRPHVVCVILDGENCWEYYRQDGLPFLRALYTSLASDPAIETVRAGDYLERAGPPKTLAKLWSGSWINSNFAIWIGHAEDNRAWDLLGRTRSFLEHTLQAHPELAEAPQTRQAWDEIYIAEGSDWCWWFGDDHSSANDETFDHLFRKHLMNVYSLMGEKVPEDLHLPIKTKRLKALVSPPLDFITPLLDGRVTNFYEWHSAGFYRTEAAGTGAMQKAENLLKTIYYGFDAHNLYFRLDSNRPFTMNIWAGTRLKFIFYRPEGHEVIATLAPAKQVQLTAAKLLTPHHEPHNLPAGAYDKIIELAIPIQWLDNPEKQHFEVIVVVEKEGIEQERWPLDNLLQIPYPTSEVFADNWML